jgi:hypothetical protein
MRTKMKKITSILLALVLCLAFATTAFGQSAVDGYNDIGGQVQSDVGGSGNGTPPAAATAETSSGSLPFTGLDVALFAGAGGLLILAGVGMRRLTRSTGTV